MKQKEFMDIQRLKEKFADGFQPGDEIVIQEKFDGSNAACRYDIETCKLVAFSRRQTLEPLGNTLNGFYNYIQSLDVNDFKDYPDYVVFGEWSGARNAIIYYPECTKKWYVFDIFDVNKETCIFTYSDVYEMEQWKYEVVVPVTEYVKKGERTLSDFEAEISVFGGRVVPHVKNKD